MAGLAIDQLVAIAGLLLALLLVGRGNALGRVSTRRRYVLGAAWALIIGLVAAVASGLRLTAG